jgi:uncharacterized protein
MPTAKSIAGAYMPRLVDALIDELASQLPALLIIGPRASGKSTTVGRKAETIVRLDIEGQAVAFRADPDAALRGLDEPVLLDEWQVVKPSLAAVRRSVERRPEPNRYFVTGSVREEIDEDEVWPGTGRLPRVAIYPMTMRERLGKIAGPTFFDRLANGDVLEDPGEAPDLRDYIEMGLQSGFPLAALRLSGRPLRVWLEGYITDLLTHDVEALRESPTRGRDAALLRRYFEAYALNSGGLADHKKIYDSAGINKNTATAYERLLINLLVAEQIPAWEANRLKRVASSPKRYMIDPALVAAALRLDTRGILADGDLLGRFIDTFVAAQLRPEVDISDCRPRLFHLRTDGGRRKVDILVELGGGRVIACVIRAGTAPKKADGRHLIWLRDELGDRFVHGVVFHTGPRVYQLDERITAAPIATLWA